jgi:hypothetical protein
MNGIGSTDLDVFPLCLGGNVFGWTGGESELELVGSVSAP